MRKHANGATAPVWTSSAALVDSAPSTVIQATACRRWCQATKSIAAVSPATAIELAVPPSTLNLVAASTSSG